MNMKDIFKIAVLSIFLIFFISSCKNPPVYLLFDKEKPGVKSEIYANNLLYGDSAYVGYCSFDGRRNELYYAITNQQWDISYILRINSDHLIDTLDFDIEAVWSGEPRLTPDNQRLFFTAILPPGDSSNWHSDLFYSDKTDSGWSTPKRFIQNSLQNEWHISFTKENTAYFGSERQGSRLKADIFYSEFERGEYKQAIKLPLGINSDYNDCDPVISYAEHFLIFHSDRPGGLGQHDLYIAFNQGDHNWSEPINLGPNVNTPAWEMGPSLSPDGNYLFFTRRESWNTTEPSKIFWVDIRDIKALEYR